MAYLNSHARTTKPTSNDKLQPMGRMPALNGIMIGFVKDTTDVQKNGRLRVWIPELGSPPDNENGWVIVNYSSPFAGATNLNSTDPSNTTTFEGTQTSYGMWMIPPDINNQVIVAFINGDPSRGVFIGCLYNQFMNNMVPGMAASTNNFQYQGKNIPVAEYNKNDTKVTLPDQATKPYEATKFRGLGNQGLIGDPIRGVTGSSARREAPSQVYGIITPGPAIDTSVPIDKIRRKGGSSFIMDDATGSEYVQLTTKSGAQININETNGFIYLINRDGTAWVQMDQSGNIDIFGAKNISMRAQRDVNIRADRNINIEAGQNIFMKAAKDTTQGTTSFTYDVNNKPKSSSIQTWDYVGEGKGSGGNIVMQAMDSWHSTTKNNAYLTVTDNNMNVSIGNSFSLTTVAGGQDFSSKLGIKLTSGGALDIATTGNIRAGSNGTVSLVGESDIIVCTGSTLNLKSAAGTIIGAGANIDMLATNIYSSANIYAPVFDTGISHANPLSAESAMSAGSAQVAEIKPLNDKLNILATWQDTALYPQWQINTMYTQGTIVTYNSTSYIANKDSLPQQSFNSTEWSIFIPENKFKRNSQSLQTIVSGLPTYEPCPEHASFSVSSVAGSAPIMTANDTTFSGSGGPGGGTSSPPPPYSTIQNSSVQGDSTEDSNTSANINLDALKCQLSIHEGIKLRVYADTGGLLTSGIGHLLRSDEVTQYPINSVVSQDQVNTWYTLDSSSAIKIAQTLFSTIWGDLTDIRKRAITDLAYNMGKSKLSKFSNFISAMNAGNYRLAGNELQSSVWFTQVGKRGPNIVIMIVQSIDPNGCDQKFPG